MVLDAVPEILSSYKAKEDTPIEIKHKGQVYKAKLLSPALSTEIDLETARQLEFVSLSSLSQEAYAAALIAVTLNTVLEEQTNWLENPDTQTALELYTKCTKESKKALTKIETDKGSQGVKNEIDWHDLPDPQYVLKVYGAYQRKHESFQEELKKNNGLPAKQVSKQPESARPLSDKETAPQSSTDQQAVSTAKAGPVQARLVRRT